MQELKHNIGKAVKNDGAGLKEALGVYDLEHTGNFVFKASYGGMDIIITTEPTDESQDEIRITDIRIAPTFIRKLGIVYHMIRGKETVETYIALPISQARYEQLAKGVTPQNKAWREIQGALENLTFLQGYDELGTWSLELTIETEGD